MNLPTKLTISRLLATPVFVLLLSISFTGHYYLALLLFLLAMLTDYIDGTLARSRGEVTDMGKLLDPLADKILIASAFIIFVGLEEIRLPAWLVAVIVSREFAITGLRLIAAGKGKVIPAGRWGKHKTLSQVVAVTAVLVYLCFSYDTRIDIEFYRPLIIILVGITAAFTFSSGCYYLIKNVGVLRDDYSEDPEEE
ncbi:MAG: CDP-diacylglycerol--glycerol-3-phosphate 3-phosphatidyltransferase [Candidatus Auribacterota bacterium]|nr:CDP-diacylglycerol--glycerol-3-phosphate 3-phosphatidyltransferase [Candidatus Auribacterota bacterium]